jgi:hypothetical protein
MNVLINAASVGRAGTAIRLRNMRAYPVVTLGDDLPAFSCETLSTQREHEDVVGRLANVIERIVNPTEDNVVPLAGRPHPL